MRKFPIKARYRDIFTHYQAIFLCFVLFIFLLTFFNCVKKYRYQGLYITIETFIRPYEDFKVGKYIVIGYKNEDDLEIPYQFAVMLNREQVGIIILSYNPELAYEGYKYFLQEVKEKPLVPTYLLKYKEFIIYQFYYTLPSYDEVKNDIISVLTGKRLRIPVQEEKLLTEEEDRFWNLCLAGNFEEAAKVSEEMGKEIKEYYLLSSICYQNIFEYNKSFILKNYYRRMEKQHFKLKDLLENKEKQFIENYLIYLMEGLTKQFIPEVQLKPARWYFKKSIELDNKNPYAFNYTALNQLKEDSLGEGIINAKRAKILYPSFPEPYVNLAYAYSKKGDKEKALDVLLECLEKCIKVPINTYESILNIICEREEIFIYSDEQKRKAYVPVIPDNDRRKRIITSLKESPIHYLKLVEQFLNKKSVNEVEKFLEIFTPPKGYRNLYIYIRARAYLLSGNNYKFFVHTEELLRNGFDDYLRLIEVGNDYFLLKAYQDAILFYRVALDNTYPLDYKYLLMLNSNIGVCYNKLEEYSEAKKWLDKAFEIDPNDPITLINLGIYHFKRGNIENARFMFRKAKRYSKDFLQIKYIETWLEKIGPL